MRGNKRFAFFVKQKEIISLVLVALVFGVSLLFLVQANYVILNPASGTNYTTTFFFNVSYANATDVTVPTNASIYYNGTFLGNASVTCSATNCWGNRSLNSTFDGLWNINITLGNDTLTNTTTGPNSTTLIRFDSTVPQVQEANITSPLTGNNKSGTLLLNVSVIDLGIGVQKIMFNITNSSGGQNGTILASNPSGNSWNATVDTTTYIDGIFNITIFANDTLNNLNSTARVFTVRFDNTVPQVQEANITSPLTGNNKSGSLLLNVSVIDVTSSIRTVFFNITNSSGGQNGTFTGTNPSGNSWNFTVDTTAYIDGIYNVTVFANDSAGNLNSTARVFTVRFDNTVPQVQEANVSAPLTGTNVSGTITLNVSAIDLTSSIGGVLFNITNSSGGQNGTVLASNTGDWWNASLDTTAYVNDLYNITIYANDSAGNLNSTARVFTVRFDNSNPSISLSRSVSSTKTSIVIDISIVDSSSINLLCTTDRSGAGVSGSGPSQTSTEGGLTCGTNYTYNIFCRDTAGNIGSTSQSFGTDSCGSTSSGSGGGGGGSSSTATTTWKSTFVATQSEVTSTGYSRELGTQDRVSLIVNTVSTGSGGSVTSKAETHYVGVLNVTGSKAMIQVSSTPQQAELAAGESKKFELNGDSYYDLFVKLNSIIAGKANVTIQQIYEIIPQAQQPSSKNATAQGNTGAAGGAGAQTGAVSGAKNSSWIWIIAAVAVLIAAVAFGVLRKKGN